MSDTFGGLDPQDEEFDSIESFVESLTDNDRTEFTHLELKCLNYRLQRVTKLIKRELEDWRLKLTHRPKERHFRGFQTSSNDRFYGPGSSKTHGGSGWANITGMAGREG